MQELLMQNRVVSFEDFRKATGYERQERVNYFQQSKNEVEMETDSDDGTQSLLSVASFDQNVLHAELNAMMLDVDMRNIFSKPGPTKVDSGDSEELEDDVMPEMLCMVDDEDDDIDESAVI